MKEDSRSVVAALSVNMLTVNVLLSVLFLPGVSARCGDIIPHLNMTAPKELEALSGSCLQIPCSFTTNQKTFNSRGTIYGVWMKNDLRFLQKEDIVVYNSSKSENRYQMNITGNLSQKNCTTLFSNLNTRHTDRYFFRIENGPFRATACANPFRITVKDSAWSPTINISGVLKEKESVTITCSAFTPCPHSPPELNWNLQQHSHRQIEENTDGTFTSKIQKTITLSDSHDGYNISCSVTYPVDGGERVKSAQTEVTLSVSYAPKDTSASISPSGLVSAGSWVNLSCSSRAKPPVSSFTWFQSRKGGAVRVAEGHFYRLNVTEMTDTGSYYCVAANVLGNHTSSWNHLQDEGSFSLSTAVITGIIFIVLICLVIYAWCYKAKYSNLQQTQNHLDMGQISNNQTEDLQYEEMSFFKRRPEPSDVSVQDSKQQQETVDTQVKGSEAEYSSEHTPDGPDDPCAQSHSSKEPALQIQANKTEEELHYEEMNCFKKRPEPCHEESELGNSSAQSDNLEGLYSQSHTSEEPALQIQANKTEEELHYEEMNCFKKRPEPCHEESELGNSSAQTDNLEGVYSQVTRKTTC
ncbi:sialoadhesin-like [Menidia menidia]